MDIEELRMMEPISLLGQHCNKSTLLSWIITMLEIGIPINDSQNLSLLRDLFLPIRPCFPAIMVNLFSLLSPFILTYIFQAHITI